MEQNQVNDSLATYLELNNRLLRLETRIDEIRDLLIILNDQLAGRGNV